MAIHILSGGGPWFLGYFPFWYCGHQVYLNNDDHTLPAITRESLTKKVRELAEKLHIAKPVNLVEKENLPEPMIPLGSTLLPGKVGIAIDPGVFEESKIGVLQHEEVQRFVLAHQLALLNNHVMEKEILIAGLVGIVAALVLPLLFPSLAMMPLLKLMIPLTLSFVVSGIYQRSLIAAADKKAIDLCGSHQGVIELFTWKKLRLLTYRESGFLGKILVTKDGNHRLDLWRPSITSRLASAEEKQS